MLDLTALTWLGSAAMGLVWGWLFGLWSAPPKISITAVVPSSNKWVRRWLNWWNTHETLCKAARALLWLIFLAAPAITVYRTAGWGPLLLFMGVAGLAWLLHHAWREQLQTRFRDGAGSGR